jgi:hypothetical protein
VKKNRLPALSGGWRLIRECFQKHLCSYQGTDAAKFLFGPLNHKWIWYQHWTIPTLRKIQIAQLFMSYSCIQWRHKIEILPLFSANWVLMTVPECGLYLLLLLAMSCAKQNLAAVWHDQDGSDLLVHHVGHWDPLRSHPPDQEGIDGDPAVGWEGLRYYDLLWRSTAVISCGLQ